MTVADEGKTIETKVGAVLLLSLPVQRRDWIRVAAGIAWGRGSGDREVQFASQSAKPGGSQEQVFRLTAGSTGGVAMKFALRRPWEKTAKPAGDLSGHAADPALMYFGEGLWHFAHTLSFSTPARLRLPPSAASPDWRHIVNGSVIPDEFYADQPYIVKTDDGAWLCVITTGKGAEGEGGQHVVTLRSTDRGADLGGARGCRTGQRAGGVLRGAAQGRRAAASTSSTTTTPTTCGR